MPTTKADISSEILSQFSEFIAGAMGLHYPESRWPDLQRAIVAIASDLGFANVATCVARLRSEPLTEKRRDVLANYLTVGETYFFREPRSFEFLASTIIPDLIQKRQNNQRRIRIWSAACCTGEEPYSIAMVLRRTIPSIDTWNVTLLATDINPQFLRKAAAGVYGRWSFRDTPAWAKHGYFRALPDGQFEISPEIRRMVHFAPMNLVEDVYPSLTNDTNAMDVIFCRNVLMYFTGDHIKNVVQKLHRAQADGGWLLLSASELSHASLPDYATVNLAGAIVHQKRDASWPAAAALDLPAMTPTALYEQGRYAEVVDKLQEVTSPEPTDTKAMDLLARSIANEGKLDEALDCCDRWIAGDKLNAPAHYMRALILQEQGAVNEAARSLRAALYINPSFIVANFALGNIERSRANHAAADMHLNIALKLLESHRDDDPVPESDGIPASRFAQMIQLLMNAEASA